MASRLGRALARARRSAKIRAEIIARAIANTPCDHRCGGITIDGRGVCARISCHYPVGVPIYLTCSANGYPRPALNRAVRMEIRAVELAYGDRRRTAIDQRGWLAGASGGEVRRGMTAGWLAHEIYMA